MVDVGIGRDPSPTNIGSSQTYLMYGDESQDFQETTLQLQRRPAVQPLASAISQSRQIDEEQKGRQTEDGGRCCCQQDSPLPKIRLIVLHFQTFHYLFSTPECIRPYVLNICKKYVFMHVCNCACMYVHMYVFTQSIHL